MSHVYARAKLSLSDREHTWKDEDGGVFSALDIGGLDIVFDSAEEARQVAVRCLGIADAIDAMRARVSA